MSDNECISWTKSRALKRRLGSIALYSSGRFGAVGAYSGLFGVREELQWK